MSFKLNCFRLKEDKLPNISHKKIHENWYKQLYFFFLSIISQALRLILWPFEGAFSLNFLAVNKVVKSSSTLSSYKNITLLTHWFISINELILSNMIIYLSQGTFYCSTFTLDTSSTFYWWNFYTDVVFF